MSQGDIIDAEIKAYIRLINCLTSSSHWVELNLLVPQRRRCQTLIGVNEESTESMAVNDCQRHSLPFFPAKHSSAYHYRYSLCVSALLRTGEVLEFILT